LLDNLIALILEIKERNKADNDAVGTIINYRYFYYTFEEMLSNWLLDMRQGNVGLVNKIKKIA